MRNFLLVALALICQFSYSLAHLSEERAKIIAQEYLNEHSSYIPGKFLKSLPQMTFKNFFEQGEHIYLATTIKTDVVSIKFNANPHEIVVVRENEDGSQYERKGEFISTSCNAPSQPPAASIPISGYLFFIKDMRVLVSVWTFTNYQPLLSPKSKFIVVNKNFEELSGSSKKVKN